MLLDVELGIAVMLVQVTLDGIVKVDERVKSMHCTRRRVINDEREQQKKRSEDLYYLVEFSIGSVLDELEGNVGPIHDPGEAQSTNVHRYTCLGALTFKVRDSKLVTTASGVEVTKRARVLDSRNLDSDCEKWE